MKATAELRLTGIHEEWEDGVKTKTLILKGEGVVVKIELEDPRTVNTLMNKKELKTWRMVLESVG